MIENFEQVTKQLAELSDAINKFKSEQVQLKIVELIFANASAPSGRLEHTDKAEPGRRSKNGSGRKRKANAAVRSAESSTDTNPKKRAAPRGNGPVATLQELLARGFFDQKRTIGDVVEYCKNDLARSIAMNNLSGPLGRFVRDQKLARSKNAENQYEYIKK